MKKQTYQKQLRDPRWIVRRCQRIILAGGQCEDCQSTDRINVHHLLYVSGRAAWEYQDSELRVLCRKCHRQAHGVEKKKLVKKIEKFSGYYDYYGEMMSNLNLMLTYKKWYWKERQLADYRGCVASELLRQYLKALSDYEEATGTVTNPPFLIELAARAQKMKRAA